MKQTSAWYAYDDVVYPPLFELSEVRPCKRCKQPFLSFVFKTARDWILLRMAYCQTCGTKTAKGKKKYINWLPPELR